jgi:hypothetical protein
LGFRQELPVIPTTPGRLPTCSMFRIRPYTGPRKTAAALIHWLANLRINSRNNRQRKIDASIITNQGYVIKFNLEKISI